MPEPGTIIAVAEICFKLGKRIVTGCKDWKNADAEIRERTTKVEFCWAQTRVQIDFMQRIAATLDEELIETMDKVLELLASKLSLASSKLDKLWEASGTSDGSSFLKVKRGRYALSKSTLDEVINDLEQWQRRFDPCWFLVMKIANPVIDEELRGLKGEDVVREEKANGEKARILGSTSSELTPSPLSLAGGLRDALRENPIQKTSVFLPTDPYLEVSDIPFTAARYGQRRKGKSTKHFIIDSFRIPPQSDPVIAKKTARDLARKLSKADPTTFRLLRCKGVLTVNDGSGSNPTHYEFVYTLPEHLNTPRSLRQALMDRDNPLSLSEQVQLAKDLANSVSYVHNFNFVHKSIRPENVLLLLADRDSSPETFLVGFENFRAADGPTRKVGDQAWEKDLYRHPSRQGALPGATYQMQHDIFSLGVCLLEVGLSTSFVVYSGHNNSPAYGPLYADAIGRLAGPDDEPPSSSSSSSSVSSQPVHLSRSYELKAHLVALARTRLRRRVGPRYAAVVVTCLTCLDADNEDFGDEREMADVDGIVVGVRFIEKIIARLGEISL